MNSEFILILKYFKFQMKSVAESERLMERANLLIQDIATMHRPTHLHTFLNAIIFHCNLLFH